MSAYSPLLGRGHQPMVRFMRHKKTGVYGAPVFYDPTLAQTGIEVFQ
jgi:hypothetical protein